MTGELEFPKCVYSSLVEPSPLDADFTNGLSIEWIDCSSPYRTFVAIYCSGPEACFVQREELRFRRTKSGVEPIKLWSGVFPISKTAYTALTTQLQSVAGLKAFNVPYDPNGLDGEWFVFRTKFGETDKQIFIAWPEGRSIATIAQLVERFKYVLQMPKGEFMSLS